ncbi:MAG TPA: HisA/HisF-related TIM barrel protein [Pirellulaceae bacterium]|jgi:phosphoribosylformimino-5-aminoimidazole carboxamide ribotide isomerase|nr:HisA/HisF-related TIM barrel protein [Pirellulaceae bacterium]
MPQSFDEGLACPVIPVIDLLDGRAVRAVRGRRSEYQPLESVLVKGSDPVDLAKSLHERCGFEEIYVADLDALQEAEPQFDVLRRIAELPIRSLLDLGVGRPEQVERARRELARTDACFVIATEASPDIETFRDCLAAFDSPQGVALCLDYLRGRFRTKGTYEGRRLKREASPDEWMSAAHAAEIGAVIALDLDQVGSDRGFAWPQGLEESPNFRGFRRKISGGGIRSREDLLAARAAGCDAILVGSALHDGRIAPSSAT